MSSIEKYISPLVESQFPNFLREQGPLFILFVEEYYKWLEENSSLYASYDDALIDGNPTYHIRRLLDYKDVDRTVDEFIVNIKEKYLKNVQFETNISKRRLIKAAHDMYGAKGSTRSFELFFKLLYGTKIEIYNPGDNIFKLSDGTWVVPVYLELTQSPRNVTFPGKQITGSVSGASAFVEYVITRNINGKLIDIAFLSNLDGNFSTGEVITDDGIFLNAPKIVGSLTSINITVAGELFEVGETVKIVSPNGVEGLARVAEIDSVTGVVRFSIIDGGWGFSNTAETTVSSKTISVANVYNTNTSITTFTRNETLTQNLFNFSLSDVNEFLNTGNEYNNGNTTTSLSVSVALTQNTTTSYTSNNANIVLNQISANVFNSNIVFEKHRAVIVTNTNVAFTVGDVVIQRTGSTNNTLGVIESISNTTALTINTTSIGTNGVHVGTFIEQSTSGATGFVSEIPRENLFTYTNVSSIAVSGVSGTFNGSSLITAYSNSLKTTALTTFEPLGAQTAYRYVLNDTNLTTNTRWSSSNTVVLVGAPTINASIILASDIGGKVISSTNVTATANIFSQNSTHIGLTSVLNTFYANEKTVVRGNSSNTYANTITVFTGSAANLFVGLVTDSEVVRLSPDLISSNNSGYSGNSVKFRDMLISGANSTYGNITSVYIESGGTGYDNTNIVTFSGGNTGVGSYGVGNAALTTDASGVITDITLTANVGNLIITTPTVSIVNSSGGSTGVGTGASLIPVSALGFVKFTGGDITTPLIDLLRFQTKTIGTIASLTNVNPGENYNINPFVLVYEPYVASYGKRDLVATINISSGAGYVENEIITQTINTPGIQITSNTFSGNASNNYEVLEVVFSTDGISNTATGIVYSTTRNATTGVHTTVLTSNTGTWQNSINVSVLSVLSNTNFQPGNKILQSTTANGILVTSNSTTLIVRNVQGTFAGGTVTSNASPVNGSTTVSSSSNTVIYTMKGLTSNGISYISNTQAYTASATAKGKIKSNSNTSYLEIKRISLFTEFTNGGTITGSVSGTTATITSIGDDANSAIIGDNANVIANVVSSEGRITSLNVIDSGFGYVDNELVTITTLDDSRSASGQANVSKQGIGQGFYSSTRGFLDDDMFIHDGDYYQNYSYEVQSPIPLDKYSDVLKKILHISGKKLFGRVVTAPFVDLNISSNSTITIV